MTNEFAGVCNRELLKLYRDGDDLAGEELFARQARTLKPVDPDKRSADLHRAAMSSDVRL